MKNRMNRPRQTPLWGIVGLAVAWNALVLHLGYRTYRALEAGSVVWSTLFAMVFVLFVGFILILCAVELYRRRSQPTIHLQTDGVAYCLGRPLRIHYAILGRARRMARLRMELRAVERVGELQHVVYQHVLVETADPSKVPTGTLSVDLPRDVMHTFQSRAASFIWELVMDAEVPRGVDIHQVHPLHVHAEEPTLNPKLLSEEFWIPVEAIPAGVETVSVALGWCVRGEGLNELEILERQEIPILDRSAPIKVVFAHPEEPRPYHGTLFSLAWAWRIED